MSGDRIDLLHRIKKLEQENEELRERTTPKKPIKDEPSKIRYVSTYVCPSCCQRFSGRVSKFCYYCGQALDWSEEE